MASTVSTDFDYVFKLVIVGDMSVGKSALLIRYVNDTYHENYLATLGVDFRFRQLKVGEDKVRL